MEDRETTLKEEIREMKEAVYEMGNGKKKKKKAQTKNFRFPGKGKLKNPHLLKGYVTVLVIEENGAWRFTRELIKDSTIKLDDTIHAVDGEDIGSYKGKPALIMPKTKKNPYNPNRGSNETYGQKHIMSRMLNEVIDGAKKKIGGLTMSIGFVVIIAVIAYALIAG